MGFFKKLGNSITGAFKPEKSKFQTKTVSNYDKYQMPIWQNLTKNNPYSQEGYKPAGPTTEQNNYMGYLNNYQGRSEADANRYFDPTAAMQRNNDRYAQIDLPAYQRDVMPVMNSVYNGPGYYGSARANAQAKGLQQSWEASQGRGYDQANMADAERYKALQAIMANLPTINQQAADYSNALRSPMNDPYYQEALKLLGLNSQTTMAGTTTQGAGLGYGMLSGAAQGAGQAAGAALVAASDRRLKTNLTQIAIHPTLKVPIYTWTYLWGEPGAGVIADELEKVMPEAVHYDVNGYASVDYSKVWGGA